MGKTERFTHHGDTHWEREEANPALPLPPKSRWVMPPLIFKKQNIPVFQS